MLSFRIAGIPVGVHLTFLFVALLGASVYRGCDIVIWTAAAFVSILAHELGHALVARGFGGQGVTITLYGMGGLTSYRHGRAMTHGRSFLVSAAGSAVGIVLGGALYLLAQSGTFDGVSHEVAVFLDSIIYTSLIWGVLNWIPIVPLDGGHMVEHLAAMVDEEKAPLIGQVVTWIAVAIVVPIAWVNGYQFGVFIIIFFAFAGLREYRDQTRAIDDRKEEGKRPAVQRTIDVTTPDDPQPAPPAAPTPPVASPKRRDPPEFPI